MKKSIFCAITTLTLISSGFVPIAQAQTTQPQTQEPLAEEVVNAIAAKTIQKFNNASCQELSASMAKQSTQNNTEQESLKDQLTARFFQLLRENPQLTNQFFSQISTPVLTKLFQCGLIPPKE